MQQTGTNVDFVDMERCDFGQNIEIFIENAVL